ncbi:MAG: 2-oxo acid dehydrogenase subunit E2 [Piscirickettsiaceae bacterium]|nr:2-oxo acid dehydrogenase subunit E2 [Piscirickettsiaceae bacterium]
MSNLIELKVPDIGDFDKIEIIEILVSIGDRVEENQDLITLESDKAAMEIPALRAGIIKEMKVTVGDKVGEGDIIAVLDIANGVAVKAKSAITIAQPEKLTTIEQRHITNIHSKPEESIPHAPDDKLGIRSERYHASPSVRQLARELGVDLSLVKSSGVNDRITNQDIKSFAKQKINVSGSSEMILDISSIPTINFEQFGEVNTIGLSRVKKISGKHLHACWLNIPHVTQFDEADITELEIFRKENREMAAGKGINLTLLVFIMKAVVASLKLFPDFNASLNEDKVSLIIKNYYNIGIAIDTPDGLMVPVIKDVDKKGFLAIASELGDISLRARDSSLTAKDLQGGTFSISSLGSIGGSFFTPIVNAPEVAILGVGRHNMKPSWNGSEFVPKLMLPLSVSYDHRVVDGANGARFITQLSHLLSDIRKFLL